MKNPLLREPLLHFAVIGALLFGVNAWFQPGHQSEAIVVSQNRIDHLAAVFARGWQRPPTERELHTLVDDYVREEVLYREAVKLGLDRDDTVVRRRLRQKMEFLSRDLVDTLDPGDKVLRDYFSRHGQAYLRPARISFRQRFFSGDTRATADSDARAALAQLQTGASADSVGDSNLLQEHYSEEAAGRIDRVFGEHFSNQLRELPRGQWSGPVRSAYGQHLVYVEHYEPQRPAEFAEVRPQVLRDWQLQEQKDILQRQYESLREKYDVRIEGELHVSAGEVARQ